MIPLIGYQRTIDFGTVNDASGNAVQFGASRHDHRAVFHFPDQSAENVHFEFVHFTVPVRGGL
jgi:hypothetical protein